MEFGSRQLLFEESQKYWDCAVEAESAPERLLLSICSCACGVPVPMPTLPSWVL